MKQAAARFLARMVQGDPICVSFALVAGTVLYAASGGTFQRVFTAKGSLAHAERPAIVTTASERSAFNGILGAFRKHKIVALDEPHWDQVASDFRIELIRQPGFAEKVDEIVFESGNSLYQKVVDRYIAGGEVPREEIAAVWRNTTQVGSCDSPVYEQFYAEVRKVNQSLPGAKKIRVLAADPPIDWNKVHSRAGLGPVYG